MGIMSFGNGRDKGTDSVMMINVSGLGQLMARAAMAKCLCFTGTLWEVVAEFQMLVQCRPMRTRSGEWSGEGSDRERCIQCK